MSSFACGDGDLCVDGVYDGTVVLEAEGYVFAESPSLFSPGSREVIAWADMPFASCRVIGGLFVQRAGAIIDSDHYPLLEELGFIVVQSENEGGPRQIDRLDGFDGVVRFGGIRGASSLQDGVAPFDEIGGFNGVERLGGSLLATAEISGFQSLKRIDGDLLVRGIENGSVLEAIGGNATFGSTFNAVDLPNLREVGGDLVLDGTRATSLGFPVLEHIGGTLEIDGNSSLAVWGGLAAGSRIDGDFLGTFNNPIRDEDFEAWVLTRETEIGGAIRICANYAEVERTCSGF